MAVASPSILGLVARMTSTTPSGSKRAINSRTRSWSGPIPSMGLIAPPSTWYRPRKPPVRSTATMSRGSSTTHSNVASRRSSAHIVHNSDSDTLKQRSQNRTRTFISLIAAVSRAVSSVGNFMRWKASRWADFGPIPGRRPNSSMTCCTASACTSTALCQLSPARPARHRGKPGSDGLPPNPQPRRRRLTRPGRSTHRQPSTHRQRRGAV